MIENAIIGECVRVDITLVPGTTTVTAHYRHPLGVKIVSFAVVEGHSILGLLVRVMAQNGWSSKKLLDGTAIRVSWRRPVGEMDGMV